MGKRIVYSYFFNYFGGAAYEDRTVLGAGIDLNIRAYKDGKEVFFEDGKEPKAGDMYLSSVFKVSYNRDVQFAVTRNIFADNMFRLAFGWEDISYEVAGYSLDVAEGKAGDLKEFEGLPDSIRNLPVSGPVYVTEEAFRAFLKGHADDFDIRDNEDAQVPAVGFGGCEV